MLKKAAYSMLGALIDCAARLPLGALYVVADVVAPVLAHVARYRRKVVESNVAESFPELTSARRRRIVRDFYRNFADYVVETFKLLHISDAEIERRMTFGNVETVDRLLDEGRTVVAYFAHTGNWEWAPSFTLHSRHGVRGTADADFCQVYRPLRDKWFDALMLRVRSRFGSESLPKATAFRSLLVKSRRGVPSVTGFMSDQHPSHGDPARPLMFLNHATAMITGTETLARHLDAAVIYWDMTKPSRGHYHIECRLITDRISALPPMAVTDTYARMLEQTIRRTPSIWLWSHKRWKHHVTLPNEQDN